MPPYSQMFYSLDVKTDRITYFLKQNKKQMPKFSCTWMSDLRKKN